MFGRSHHEQEPAARDIGLLGIDTRFEGSIRFTGTLRIDGAVVGNIQSQPGCGSVLIVNQQATVTGDIVSDCVLISGRVEGNVRAHERVEIFRSGQLKGDVYTADIMIEGGAEFQGYCHMANGAGGSVRTPPAGRAGKPANGQQAGAPAARAEPAGTARA